MSKRTFEIGVNELNGYTINVLRVVSAYNNADNSRIAAKYFGDITHPNGDITFMGDDGMTVTQIKRIVGGVTRQYNRGNRNELKQLESLKSKLESLGVGTADIDAKIAERTAEIEAARIAAENRERNRARLEELNDDLRTLVAIRNKMVEYGISTEEIDAKADAIYAEISALTA